MLITSAGSSKQPPELYLLTFAEFWDRFSYYGIQALLVLYLTKILLFSDKQAYGLYGAFTALTFAATVIGGIAADRLIGPKRAIMLGAGLIILGNLLLLVPTQKLMYWGLASLIGGIGLFKPSNTNFVGILYDKADVRREGGFSILYIGMNAGALLGPLVYGYISQHYGWHYGFAISAIGMIFALSLFVLKRRILHEGIQQNSINLNRRLAIGVSIKHSFYPAIFVAIVVFVLLMYYDQFFGNLLIVIALSILLALAGVALKSNPVDRRHIIGLTILSFFCVFFFSCELQTATTLTLFIERSVNRHIFGLYLPTMMFLSLEPFFIILAAPFIALFWSWLSKNKFYLSPTVKIAFGLLFAAVGFMLFALAANNAHKSYLPIVAIIIGNLALGLGELFILPIMLNTVMQFAPVKLRGTMIGVLFFSLAFSGYLAGAIAKFIAPQHLVKSSAMVATSYASAFMKIALVALVITFLLLLINPWMKRLLQTEEIYSKPQ